MDNPSGLPGSQEVVGSSPIAFTALAPVARAILGPRPSRAAAANQRDEAHLAALALVVTRTLEGDRGAALDMSSVVFETIGEMQRSHTRILVVELRQLAQVETWAGVPLNVLARRLGIAGVRLAGLVQQMVGRGLVVDRAAKVAAGSTYCLTELGALVLEYRTAP